MLIIERQDRSHHAVARKVGPGIGIRKQVLSIAAKHWIYLCEGQNDFIAMQAESLFLTGRDRVSCTLRQRLRFRRGGVAALNFRRFAVTGPQLGTPHRSDKFAARRLSRPYLSERPVPTFGVHPEPRHLLKSRSQ
jgi:hypothetical protein